MKAVTELPEVFSGPLGEQLHHRVAQTIADAERLLGAEIDPGGGDDLTRLRSAVSALQRRLAGGSDPDPGEVDHAVALERLRARFESRFESLARAQAAVAELRAITSPAAMLSRAPAVLCASSAFRRAVLSIVRDGTILPEEACFADDPAGAARVVEQLRSTPVRLEHPLIETELLRRRRATIVLDARAHPRVDRRLAELMGWRAYAAAPLLIGSEVIGVIHADRGPDAPVDVLDRDVLWEFASGLVQAYESASLRRTLRHERDQMRQFLEWARARSDLLTAAPIDLGERPSAPLPSPEPFDADSPAEGRDDRVVFAGLLTRRELEVLRLLVDGATNRAVASELVLSGGTVKFHVNSILRKLHVANRAEAVARYLALLGMPPP